MEEYISDNSLYIRSKNNSMINRKMIGRVLGMLLFIELGMFLLCAGVSAGYGESDYKYFLYTCIINADIVWSLFHGCFLPFSACFLFILAEALIR